MQTRMKRKYFVSTTRSCEQLARRGSGESGDAAIAIEAERAYVIYTGVRGDGTWGGRASLPALIY